MGGVRLGGIFISRLWENKALQKEAVKVQQIAQQLKETVNRKNTQLFTKGRMQEDGYAFFDTCMIQPKLEMTKEFTFLALCYGLAVTRKPYQRLENGIVLTHTESTLLIRLSKQITLIDAISRNQILEIWKQKLSALSVEMLYVEAEKISLLDNQAKDLVLLMLSEKRTCIFSPDPEKYLPKTFGCVFYEYQAILTRLNEEQAVVCVKNIWSHAKPFYVFLRAEKQIGSYTLLPEEQFSQMDPETPLVVFEGLVFCEQQMFCEKVNAWGFSEIILTNAAIVPQYYPDSSLEQMANTQAIQTVEHYRNKLEIPSIFLLDHVYCDTFQQTWRKS